MTQRLRGVLKASRTRPAGRREIGAAPPTPVGPSASARIVHRDDGQAVVEITCGCGQVTRLRCTWPAGASADMQAHNGSETGEQR